MANYLLDWLFNTREKDLQDRAAETEMQKQKDAYLENLRAQQEQARIRLATEQAIRLQKEQDAMRRAGIASDIQAYQEAYNQFNNNPAFGASPGGAAMLQNLAEAIRNKNLAERGTAASSFNQPIGTAEGASDLAKARAAGNQYKLTENLLAPQIGMAFDLGKQQGVRNQAEAKAATDEAFARSQLIPAQNAADIALAQQRATTAPVAGEAQRQELQSGYAKAMLDWLRNNANINNAPTLMAVDTEAAKTALNDAIANRKLSEASSQLPVSSTASQWYNASRAGLKPLGVGDALVDIYNRPPMRTTEIVPVKVGNTTIPKEIEVTKPGGIENRRGGNRYSQEDLISAGITSPVNVISSSPKPSIPIVNSTPAQVIRSTPTQTFSTLPPSVSPMSQVQTFQTLPQTEKSIMEAPQTFNTLPKTGKALDLKPISNADLQDTVKQLVTNLSKVGDKGDLARLQEGVAKKIKPGVPIKEALQKLEKVGSGVLVNPKLFRALDNYDEAILNLIFNRQ